MKKFPLTILALILALLPLACTERKNVEPRMDADEHGSGVVVYPDGVRVVEAVGIAYGGQPLLRTPGGQFGLYFWDGDTLVVPVGADPRFVRALAADGRPGDE